MLTTCSTLSSSDSAFVPLGRARDELSRAEPWQFPYAKTNNYNLALALGPLSPLICLYANSAPLAARPPPTSKAASGARAVAPTPKAAVSMSPSPATSSPTVVAVFSATSLPAALAPSAPSAAPSFASGLSVFSLLLSGYWSREGDPEEGEGAGGFVPGTVGVPVGGVLGTAGLPVEGVPGTAGAPGTVGVPLGSALATAGGAVAGLDDLFLEEFHLLGRLAFKLIK
jgi:hypothetical protein